MIYVGPIVSCVPNRHWRWEHVSHMFTEPGNEESLHRLAAQIGLRRGWYQHDKTMPHYDLTTYMRRLAVIFGANAVSREREVETLRLWRQYRSIRQLQDGL